MKLEFTTTNTTNISSGTYRGTWTGSKIILTAALEIETNKKPRGINVPVVVVIDKGAIYVYVA